MNVLLLSDFSSSSTTMLEYAAMLFNNQDVSFTILHVKSPCQKGSCDSKCNLVYDQKLMKNKEVLQEKGFSGHHIQTKFIDGPYIDSIRAMIIKENIDLMLLGNSCKEITGTNLFFDKKTLEIITKVKCSAFLIPEKAKLKLPKTALLPTDFSITSDASIFKILSSLAFVKKASISLLPTDFNKALGSSKEHSKELIYNAVHALNFKTIEEINSPEKDNFFNRFDLVVVMAKNLSIFKALFSNAKASLCLPKVPILFLHDTRKI